MLGDVNEQVRKYLMKPNLAVKHDFYFQNHFKNALRSKKSSYKNFQTFNLSFN